MSLLEEILATKQKEVANAKVLQPVALLEESIYFQSPVVSLKRYLRRPDKHGILAEIKRRSPSKGWLKQHVDVESLSIGYMQAGASALSILTDTTYFAGSLSDLKLARQFNYCPLLRKDFIIDEYQIIEARSYGADAVLLIAAALTAEATTRLTAFAKSLGLEVLLEVHSRAELDTHLNAQVDCIGVNNRNLATFQMQPELSFELAPRIPQQFLKVAESGIKAPGDVHALRQAGYEGFLIGEHFMRAANPALACAHFIRSLEEGVSSLEQSL